MTNIPTPIFLPQIWDNFSSSKICSDRGCSRLSKDFLGVKESGVEKDRESESVEEN